MVRLTLRIPGVLHERLVLTAGMRRRSLNSEIVARLESGFPPDLVGVVSGDSTFRKLVEAVRSEERAAVHRPRKTLCPHRVPAGSFCKVCGN